MCKIKIPLFQGILQIIKYMRAEEVEWSCSTTGLDSCSNLIEFYIMIFKCFMQLTIISYDKTLVANDSWMWQITTTLVTMQAGWDGRVRWMSVSWIWAALENLMNGLLLFLYVFFFFPYPDPKCLITVIPMWICCRLFFTTIPSQDFSSPPPNGWYTWKNYQQNQQDILSILSFFHFGLFPISEL